MAQGMLGQALRDVGPPDILVKSAGLNALIGEPADYIAQSLMLSRGIDISRHRAQQLDRELMNWADIVLIMESGHKKLIESLEPTARGKVYRIGEWDNFDVPDPYGQTKEAFEQVAQLINTGVKHWVPRLVQ